MRLPQAVFLGCACVAMVTSVWFMSSFYSMSGGPSVWEDMHPSATGLSSSPTGVPTAEHLSQEEEESIKADLDRQKEVAEEEKAHEEEELTEEQKSKPAPGGTTDVSKEKQIAESAEQEVKDYEKAYKALEAELAEIKAQKNLEESQQAEEEERQRQIEEQEAVIQEEIQLKKDETNSAYCTIRDKQLEVEYEALKKPIVIPTTEIGPNGVEPRGHQILILTAFDGGGSTGKSNISETLMYNRNEYCNYHGYIHHFVNTSKYQAFDELHRKPVWWKMPALREAFDKFPEVEWIWWMDADMIITNQQLDLAEHLLNPYVLSHRLTYGRPVNDLGDYYSGQMYPTRDKVDHSKIDAIFSQDRLGINAGSFFLRRSAYADLIIDLWQDPLFIASHFEREEQDAYVHLYQTHQIVRQHTGLVPQRLINAYANYEIAQGNWVPGDFALHFAGKNGDAGHVDSWHHHFNQIVRVPEKYRLY